jgi:hypothetical protein
MVGHLFAWLMLNKMLLKAWHGGTIRRCRSRLVGSGDQVVDHRIEFDVLRPPRLVLALAYSSNRVPLEIRNI